ncbi:hypothetical protein I5E68_01050 [Novosphingobium sp. YJ-S2-02]|uniref:Uncharacterized protein n=1 Tax=Novosphingobium aureum TaxID=2792964 RepID=A0A931H9L4_9SPHN|nr:hypothetical protein [Novosphingobium aureum]MBH0111538.1 hypothetical protein [Novosphingobium aureum]
MVGTPTFVKRRLRFVFRKAIAEPMEGPSKPETTGDLPKESGARTLTREERLAAKLRENLRRRKAQARAIDASGPSPDAHGESHRLPKTSPES